MTKDLAGSSSEYGKAKLPKRNAPVLAVVKFIEDNLPGFINEQLKDPVDNEPGLTQRLVNHLSFLNTNYPFYFDKENMEDESRGNSPRSDFAAYTRERIVVRTRTYSPKDRFFAVEAKRLGLPNPGKREKEYLVGHWEDDSKQKYRESGGIERFKKHIHGKNLTCSGMIGYVQKHDFKYWRDKINSWIEDFIQYPDHSSVAWSKDDKLISDNSSYQRIAKHTSNNSRFDAVENMKQIESITLYPLWVDLRTDEAKKDR